MSPENSPQTASPFLIRCSTCGAPAGFDIRGHIYKCAHCGASTDATAPLEDLEKWRRAARDSRRASILRHPAVICTCPGCGASMAVGEGEMSGTCPFCGGTMARRPAGDDAQNIPEVVIPFVLTADEAQERIDRWLDLHPRDRCAGRLRKSRNQLEAVFLPYRLVKGPVTCTVERAGARRTYECGAFVNGSAINASRDMPNPVLDAIEPFDWSEARAFDWGYLSGGQKARFPDTDAVEMEKRTLAELEEACRPMVEKELMTVGVSVKARLEEALDMPALLPVYVIRGSGFHCFVNGQTGRVAVSDGTSDTRISRWWLPPLILSLLFFWLTNAFFAAGHAFALRGGSFGLAMLRAMTIDFLSGETLAIAFRQTLLSLPTFIAVPILFFIFRRNRAETECLHIPATPRCRAILNGSSGRRLDFIEGREAILDAAEVRPQFFESEKPGGGSGPASGRQPDAASKGAGFWEARGRFPARIRFFPPRRVALWTVQSLLTLFLPPLVSLLGWLCGAEVFTPALLAVSFLWLFFAAPWPMMSAARRIGILVFDNPAVQRIGPGGALTWVERGRSESIFTGLRQIFSPFCFLIRKIMGRGMTSGIAMFFLWPIALTPPAIPLAILLGPMLDTTGGQLSQASSQGSSRRLMTTIFARSADLTQREWDDLPQVALGELLTTSARGLSMNNASGLYKPLKTRLQEALGKDQSLDFSKLTENFLNVRIPASREETDPNASPGNAASGSFSGNFTYSRKSYFGSFNREFQTFIASFLDVENAIPPEKLPLVHSYLNNFQRALPWGAFSLMGKNHDHLLFTIGLNVKGLKRIPRGWDELTTFWLLDVTETAEVHIRALSEGTTESVTPDEQAVRRISRSFWSLAVQDGREEKEGEAGRFDEVRDMTPEQAIAAIDNFVQKAGWPDRQSPGPLVRTWKYFLYNNRTEVQVTADASRQKSVLIRASVKLRLEGSGAEGMILEKIADNNSLGHFRVSFNPEEKTLETESRLFLRLLKNPPEDLAQSGVIAALSSMKMLLEKLPLSPPPAEKKKAEQVR